MKIDMRFKIPLIGEYNKSVSICPECKCNLLFNDKHGLLYTHIIGFATSNIGDVAIVECPECFTNWYFHARVGETGSYTFFLELLEQDELKHFKK